MLGRLTIGLRFRLGWRRKAWIGVIAVLIAIGGQGFANSFAVAVSGNIFVVQSDGERVRVTSSGSDSDPDLSPDGRKVVFVRRFSDERSEIWIASVVAAAASPHPLPNWPLRINGRVFAYASSPRFSPDGGTVFFLVPFGATTQAIVKVALANPDPQFVAAALSFKVVVAGQYKGDLVARIRKAKLAPGYYEWYWLLTPEGRELGIVGQDERDVALFMEQQK